MDIYDAAGYDAESFAKLCRIMEDVVGTGNSQEHIVCKGVETFDRDSYVAGLLIGIAIGHDRQRDAVG